MPHDDPTRGHPRTPVQDRTPSPFRRGPDAVVLTLDLKSFVLVIEFVPLVQESSVLPA